MNLSFVRCVGLKPIVASKSIIVGQSDIDNPVGYVTHNTDVASNAWFNVVGPFLLPTPIKLSRRSEGLIRGRYFKGQIFHGTSFGFGGFHPPLSLKKNAVKRELRVSATVANPGKRSGPLVRRWE